MSDVQTAATSTAAAPPLAAPKLGRWANANELPVIDFAPLAAAPRLADTIARLPGRNC